MARAHSFDGARRALLAGAAAALASWPAAAAPRGRVVTLLGDSVTAGYGLPAAAALPAQLQAALDRMRVPAQVRGAGVSGDTTADGLARVDFSVQADTSLCVVELGGNDLLQGVEPWVVRDNLSDILVKLSGRRIAAILTGVQAPPQIGSAYARAFDAAFATAARAGGAIYYPNLFAGVGRNPSLLQHDAIHPNAAGVRIIASRLAPVVARALAGRPLAGRR